MQANGPGVHSPPKVCPGVHIPVSDDKGKKQPGWWRRKPPENNPGDNKFPPAPLPGSKWNN